MKVIVFALLAILLLSTLACGGGGEEEEVVSTPTPTPTPTGIGSVTSDTWRVTVMSVRTADSLISGHLTKLREGVYGHKTEVPPEKGYIFLLVEVKLEILTFTWDEGDFRASYYTLQDSEGNSLLPVGSVINDLFYPGLWESIYVTRPLVETTPVYVVANEDPYAFTFQFKDLPPIDLSAGGR